MDFGLASAQAEPAPEHAGAAPRAPVLWQYFRALQGGRHSGLWWECGDCTCIDAEISRQGKEPIFSNGCSLAAGRLHEPPAFLAEDEATVVASKLPGPGQYGAPDFKGQARPRKSEGRAGRRLYVLCFGSIVTSLTWAGRVSQSGARPWRHVKEN